MIKSLEFGEGKCALTELLCEAENEEDLGGVIMNDNSISAIPTQLCSTSTSNV